MFPSGEALVAMDLLPPLKGYIVTTGRQLYNINSPSAFAPIPGVGTNGPVTQGHTLYMRSNGPFLVQLTMTGVDGGTSQEIPLYGTMLIEFNAINPSAIPRFGAGTWSSASSR